MEAEEESREATEKLLEELSTIDWAAFIQPPPRNECKPEHIVRYLARYMTGADLGQTPGEGRAWPGSLLARSKTSRAGTEEVSLDGAEFVRSWSLHIVRQGIHKSAQLWGVGTLQTKRVSRVDQSLVPS